MHTDEGAESISGYYGMENRGDVVEKNGITVIRDCYNASLDSSNAAFNSLNQTASESRKIVVFGDMLEMGDYSEEIHKKVGISAAEHKIDILLTYGKYSEYVNDSAKDSGLSLAFHFDDKNKLIDKLCSIVEPGDTVLFKAGNGMHFISLADEFIRRIYGKGI